MSKRNLITIVVSVSLVMFFACWQVNAQTKKVVKTISFDGGSCQLYELVKNSMFAPANMQENEKAFMLRLKCSLKQNAGADKLSVLYDKGEFVAPDGKRYKASVSALKWESDDVAIYSLIVAIPKDADVETLKFVYSNQVLLLNK